MALTKIDDRGLNTPIDLLNNEKIRFGNSTDLEVYHTGSHGYIDNSTGSLIIRTNVDADVGGDIFIKPHDDQTAIAIIHDNAVQLFYDGGGPKFETTSTGATVNGLLTTTGNLRINGSPAWAETGGDYGNLSIRGTTASSSGFLNLGNGAAATNSEFDLARIKIHNGATEVARITGITGDGNNDSGEIWFATQASGGSLTTALVIDKDQKVGIGDPSPAAGLDVKVDTNPVLAIDRGSANTANFNLQYNGTLTGQLGAANGEFQISAAGASTPISFYTNGGERLNIKSDGQVEHTYDITADGDAGLILNTDDSGKASSILFQANSENRARLDVKRRSGDGGIVTLQVARADNSNNLVNVFTSQCATSGDTTPDLTLGGNLVVASGHGIQFSDYDEDTNDGNNINSNTLDDYEEGTFTPTFGGSSGESGQVYTTQVGSYTKIGNLVSIRFNLTLNDKGSTTGTYIQIKSLPFTAGSSSYGSNLGLGLLYFADLTDDWIYLGLQLGEGTSAAYIWGKDSAGTARQYPNLSDFSNQFQCTCSFTYVAA